jgi:hypothetical protein
VRMQTVAILRMIICMSLSCPASNAEPKLFQNRFVGRQKGFIHGGVWPAIETR